VVGDQVPDVVAGVEAGVGRAVGADDAPVAGDLSLEFGEGGGRRAGGHGAASADDDEAVAVDVDLGEVEVEFGERDLGDLGAVDDYRDCGVGLPMGGSLRAGRVWLDE
jgi:hypothetical protein